MHFWTIKMSKTHRISLLGAYFLIIPISRRWEISFWIISHFVASLEMEDWMKKGWGGALISREYWLIVSLPNLSVVDAHCSSVKLEILPPSFSSGHRHIWSQSESGLGGCRAATVWTFPKKPEFLGLPLENLLSFYWYFCEEDGQKKCLCLNIGLYSLLKTLFWGWEGLLGFRHHFVQLFPK